MPRLKLPAEDLRPPGRHPVAGPVSALVMKLDTEFIQLPLRFDADRLALEAAAFSPDDWSAHPTGFPGNAAIRLISAHGGANDAMGGPMQATPFLDRCPYIRQVLASFQSVFGRSRLMLLGGGNVVPAHCDVNYHWYSRVRVHVPIVTFPEVAFHCGGKQVHMGRGEAWIFDNWREHRVINPTAHARIHLVADTSGSAMFWSLVERGRRPGVDRNSEFQTTLVPYRQGENPVLDIERHNVPDVMTPGEVEALTGELLDDLHAAQANDNSGDVQRFTRLIRRFCQEWRMTWALHGREASGWPLYRALLDTLQADISSIETPLLLASNGARAGFVLLGRVITAALNVGDGAPAEGIGSAAANSDYPIDAAKPATARHLGRNDPCNCGSGKRYKHCHGVVL